MSDRNANDHSTGLPKAGALEDLRVVDLSRFIAGPYCAMLLGDMGADVIKVEPPGRGENSRLYGPFVEGESLYTMVFNRNKRSLTLDLRSRQGKDLLLGLLQKADVLVENFVPGTLEKMGLDWDTLKKLNPRLIVTRISGFGQSGPLASKPCFDVIGQTMSGLMEITVTRIAIPQWQARMWWTIRQECTQPSARWARCRHGNVAAKDRSSTSR